MATAFDDGLSTIVDNSGGTYTYTYKALTADAVATDAVWICKRTTNANGTERFANGVSDFSRSDLLITVADGLTATYTSVSDSALMPGIMVSPTIGGVPKSEIVVLGLSTGSPILGVRFTLNPGDDVTAGNRLSLNSALDTTLILPDTQSQRFGPFRDSDGEFIPLTYCALVGVQVSSTYTSAQYMLGYNDTDLADAIANMAKCLFSADDKVYELIVTVTSSFVATGSQNAVIVKLEGVSYA